MDFVLMKADLVLPPAFMPEICVQLVYYLITLSEFKDQINMTKSHNK